MFARGVVLFVAIALSSASALAATPPAKVTAVKVTTVEGITEYKLANGLTVLLAPDGSKPVTTVNVTYEVGSRMEKYGETGMAHLLEHLMFKGTPKEPGKTIVEEFSRRGMRFNGSTYFDRTNYFETFAASDDNLDWALKMEADRMAHSNIARTDLDSEMTVVRNEMEAGENSPYRVLDQKMTAAAYQWHNYGKSTIGARADVENVNIAHLKAFYRTYYQPDNAVLIVTGQFDPGKVLAQVSRYFGAIPKPKRVLEPTWTVEPVQDGPRTVTLQRVGASPLVAALYHLPQGASADFAAIIMLSDILGNTPNGRLYKALVEKKLATGVAVSAAELHDPGHGTSYAVLEKTQSPDAAAKAMLETVEGVARQPVTESELKRAQALYLNRFERMMSDPAQFGVRLSESIAAGDWRLLFIQRDRVAAVTVADVQRVAQTYFKESNRTLGQFIPTQNPDRATMPPPVDIAALAANYQGREAVAAGEAFDPSPANIEKHSKRLALPNGMQVIELAKQTRGNTVSGTLVMGNGTLETLAGKRNVPSFTAAMLQRGAGNLSRQEIADRLQELKATIGVRGSFDQLTVNFQTRRDKLPELLELIAVILRHPTFPEAELEQLKTQALAGLDEQRHEPQGVAQNALGRYDNPYPKGDIRYIPSFDEEVEITKAVTMADIKAFHDNFYGADHAQLALVGDFDPAVMEPVLGKLFGDWKAKIAPAHVPEPYRQSQMTAQQFETPDKANAVYFARLAIPVKADDPDVVPLILANHILGGGGLKSRIVDRLRQQDGISYGAGSGLSEADYEANSALMLSAIYAPQNLARLKTAMAEVLAAFRKDGVTEQELAAAKSGLLQQWTISRTQDGALASQLALNLKLGRTMAFTDDREARIKSATVEQVNGVIRKYLHLDQLVQMYAGDFAKARSATP
ncbi:MAG: M16 family metallopeptidase [Rhizomicrobium sp.]